MFRKIPFVKNELNKVGELPGMFGGPPVPLRDTPVMPRENTIATYFERHPYWLQMPGDTSFFHPPLYNNNLGRGGPGGTTDAFGIVWEYIEVTGGSIVRPGEPFLSNANEWKEKIIFPDLDTWDWAGEAERQRINPRFSGMISLVNGFWFERLISFMDFAEAAVALIDPDQSDAIAELFEASTEFACKVVDKLCEYWPALDGIQFHDDWGSQKDPFFSEEIARKLFLPNMKTLCDHIHSKGRYTSLHSCGHVESRVNIFIEAGIDQWDPQTMNDTHKLYDEVGDKIIISVVPTPFDPAKTSEEAQRQAARDHVDRFCKPGKPSMLGHYANPMATQVFKDEAYEYSRKLYLKQ
jgi:hypothetical protein